VIGRARFCSGIFLFSSEWARAVASVKTGFCGLDPRGIIVLLRAFCYAELAGIPKQAAPYVLPRSWPQPLWGFHLRMDYSFLDRPVAIGQRWLPYFCRLSWMSCILCEWQRLSVPTAYRTRVRFGRCLAVSQPLALWWSRPVKTDGDQYRS